MEVGGARPTLTRETSGRLSHGYPQFPALPADTYPSLNQAVKCLTADPSFLSYQPSSCLQNLLPFLGPFVSLKPGNDVKWRLSASLLLSLL